MHSFEYIDGLLQALEWLFIEKQTRLILYNSLCCSSFSVGDHWCSMTHGFDRCNPKIFFLRHEVGSCMYEICGHFFVWGPKNPLYIRLRFFSQFPIQFGISCSGYLELFPVFVECVYEEIEFFVWDTPADGKVVLSITNCFSVSVFQCCKKRIYYVALSMVVFLYPICGVLGIGDIDIRPHTGNLIPSTQPGKSHMHHQFSKWIEPSKFQILFVLSGMTP